MDGQRISRLYSNRVILLALAALRDKETRESCKRYHRPPYQDLSPLIWEPFACDGEPFRTNFESIDQLALSRPVVYNRPASLTNNRSLFTHRLNDLMTHENRVSGMP